MNEHAESEQEISEKDFSSWTDFLPSKGFWLTPSLLIVNVGLFIVMAISGVGFMEGDSHKLLDWGGNLDRFTFGGEPWRLISSMFLHSGIMHVFMNMYGLLYIGMILELTLGSGKMATGYFLAGIAGSLASAWWNYRIVSIGASGAIFGLDGMFLVLLLLRKELFGEATKGLLVSIGIFIFYNLAYGLGKGGGIDNAAHIGGLLGGVIYGLFLSFSLKEGLAGSGKKLFFGLAVFVPAFLMATVWFGITKPIGNFYKQDDQFQANWNKADSSYNLIPTDENDSVTLLRVQNELFPIWEENVRISNEMQSGGKSALKFVKETYSLIAQKNIEKNNLLIELIETDDSTVLTTFYEKNAEITRVVETLNDFFKN